MSCKKEWNREFMYRNMTKTFVLETLKEHAEQLMIEREKALLPFTQPIVERIQRMDAIYQENQAIHQKIFCKRREEREALNQLRRNRTHLLSQGVRIRLADIRASEVLTDSDQSDNERQGLRQHHARLPLVLRENLTHWHNLRRERKALEDERQTNYDINNHLVILNQRRIRALRDHVQGRTPTFAYDTDADADDEEERGTDSRKRRSNRSFVRTCPQQECRGFLNQKWVCGLCNTHVCSKCHEVLPGAEGQEHTCDPNLVATAQLLMRDTKGCPKCGIQIHKIDGCNMMFCTQCHTPFCWRTGEIIRNERIHNPHYYEWLRQNSRDGTIPREPGDEIGNACQDHISVRSLREKLLRHDLLSYDLEDLLWNVHRIHIHIEAVEIPRLQEHDTEDHVDMRIRYLSHECTEREWKHELYKRAKRSEKNIALRQIYQMILMVIQEELHRILHTEQLTFHHIMESITSLENMRTYANQQFLDVSELYQCRVPKIEDATWRIGFQRAQRPSRKQPLKAQDIIEK